MRISSVPLDIEDFKSTAVAWLMPILEHPDMVGPRLPQLLTTTLYVNNISAPVLTGTWNIGNTINLPGPGESVNKLDKLCILSALARQWGIADQEAVRDRIMSKLAEILREVSMNVYANTIMSNIRPSRIALEPNTFQVAAELNGVWLFPSGAPARVDQTWNTLDF